jgi:hypothetical protein
MLRHGGGTSTLRHGSEAVIPTTELATAEQLICGLLGVVSHRSKCGPGVAHNDGLRKGLVVGRHIGPPYPATPTSGGTAELRRAATLRWPRSGGWGSLRGRRHVLFDDLSTTQVLEAEMSKILRIIE